MHDLNIIKKKKNQTTTGIIMTLYTLYPVTSADLSLFCFVNIPLQNSASEFPIWQQHWFLTVNI